MKIRFRLSFLSTFPLFFRDATIRGIDDFDRRARLRVIARAISHGSRREKVIFPEREKEIDHRVGINGGIYKGARGKTGAEERMCGGAIGSADEPFAFV